MAKAVVALIAVVLILAATLGLQLVSYPGPSGRTTCLLAKDELSFKDTVIAADTLPGMIVRHPLLTTQIVAGRGLCIGR